METSSNILAVGKYSPARDAGRVTRKESGAPKLFIPTVTGARERVKLRDWYWREIREGGFLCEYLAAEKHKTPRMIRRVARMMSGFQQNNKSDFRRLAAIPARTYQRWKAEDEHFFEDDDNLRSLKRDNDDLPIFVGAKRVKGTRTVYGPKSKVQSPTSGAAA